MTILFAISVALLAAMGLIALVNLLLAPRLHRYPPEGDRHVSLLVPARDEAENLVHTLPALLALEGTRLEVLVLDDDSSDATPRLVREAEARSGGRLRLLSGTPPPPGWTGKNWACHTLAEAARAELLIFCDADVRPAPDAVTRTVGAMRSEGAGAFTALPRQRFGSWPTAALVPLVAWLPVVALLPLPLVHRTRSPSISMGNGQWLAFTRASYEAAGGHAAVRGEVLDDVGLARRAKGSGARLLVTAAPRTLEVGMYRDWSEMREGFGKNLLALGGGTTGRLLGVLLVFLLVMVVPLAAPMFGGWTLWALGLLLLVRGCAALLLGQGAASVLLHPLGAVLGVYLSVESAYRARRGAMWKGRTLPAPHTRGAGRDIGLARHRG